MAMQAGSAKASACIGDGPSTESLSRVIFVSPDRPPSTRSCSQISSTTVGGFSESAMKRFCHERQTRRWECRRGPDRTPARPLEQSSGGLGSLCRVAGRRALSEQRRHREPANRQNHQHVGQVLAVDAVGSERLGGVVQGPSDSMMLASVSSWKP